MSVTCVGQAVGAFLMAKGGSAVRVYEMAVRVLAARRVEGRSDSDEARAFVTVLDESDGRIVTLEASPDNLSEFVVDRKVLEQLPVVAVPVMEDTFKRDGRTFPVRKVVGRPAPVR